MAKILKDYQLKAVEETIEFFDFYLNRDNGRQIIIKAPTGSGKTFMMTKFLERVSLEHEDEKFAFIWASIGKGELHRQSYDSVRKELKGYPDCKLLDESFVSANTIISDKQILFVNWEKLVQKNRGTNEWKNALMRDQEGRNFIELIEETKRQGIKVCLIVDESHIGKAVDTSISQFRDNIIQPSVTISMSATPNVPDSQVDVMVKLEDAIEEGMIKENLIINKDISKNSVDGTEDDDSMRIVLNNAEKRRKLIIERFKHHGSNVNPLVLVQVPNTHLGDEAIAVVREFLREQGITEENGKLAIWLSGYKHFDSEAIKANDNKIEYMIFKTVVDTGWDCPRSHILVKFRDVYSRTAKVQTIGRILRTPEAKKYFDPVLDNGYVYTNMEYIDPRDEEYSANRTKDLKSNVKMGWDKTLPDIKSFYKSRVSSYNSADTRIYEVIDEVFVEYFALEDETKKQKEVYEVKGLSFEGLEQSSIIEETGTKIGDWVGDGSRIGGGLFNIDVKAAEVEIKGKYEDIISKNLNGLARVRSLSPIKQGIARTLQKYVEGVDRSNSLTFAQSLVVRNEETFEKIINLATNYFKERYPDANMDGEYSEWEISDEAAYSSETYKEIRSLLSLYDMMYVLKTGTSGLEERFLQELDTNYEGRIEWVWHNGSEPTIENFGVMIKKDAHAFRPDFIIKFLDGRVGIFDTKGVDFMVEDTTEKAIALQQYIQENKDEGKNIFGGIIVEYNGVFYLNEHEDYKPITVDRSQWTRIINKF